MTLSKKQINDLMDMLKKTRDQEASCDECHEALAEFAENQLAGQSVSQSLDMVRHHLDICGDCREEFKALLAALGGA